MIFVDLESCRPDEEWLKKAERATKDLLAGDVERRKRILKNRPLWRDLKEKFMSASQLKCWYCETLINRQPGTMDHFRPKGRVTDVNHEGYWWLAYDWRNYRYSCTLCNSANANPDTGDVEGKANHFPLLEEAKRARTFEGDIAEERPLLLDPTDLRDPDLLAFDQDGNAAPRSVETKDPVGHKRAKRSVVGYHLNHPQTSERRKALFDQIRRCVIRGDELRLILENLELDAQRRTALNVLLEQNVCELTRCFWGKGEYSAAARGFLLGFRNRGWVGELLNLD